MEDFTGIFYGSNFQNWAHKCYYIELKVIATVHIQSIGQNYQVYKSRESVIDVSRKIFADREKLLKVKLLFAMDDTK